MEKKTGSSQAEFMIQQEFGILEKLRAEQGEGVWASLVGSKLTTSILYLENKSLGDVMEAMLTKLVPMVEEVKKDPELYQQLVGGIITEMRERRMGVKRE